MKHWLYIALLALCVSCAAQDAPEPGPSSKAQKLARKSFEHALLLQTEGRPEEAFLEASNASSLVPSNSEYFTAREALRDQVTARYIERGNWLADNGDLNAAATQFQAALSIDSQNGYAQQRLEEVKPPADAYREHVLELMASVNEPEARPNPGKQDFHVHGETRELYEAIGRAFGISMAYDPGITSHRVRFDVEGLDFFKAMKLAGQVTHTFWAPITDKRVMIANNTPDLVRQYQPLSLQTFYLSNALSPAEETDLVNLIRSVLDVRTITLQSSKNIMTVRAPRQQLDIISALADDLLAGHPQVLLEVKAYEVDYDKLRHNGLVLPTDFRIFNVFAEIYRVLGPAATPIINQLKSGGAIDPSKIPTSALAGLQGSPLLLPFLFFGKGYGLTGITVSSIAGSLNSTYSEVKTLEHLTVRATTGTAATFRIGTRFPIQTGSFTNVGISNQGLPVVGSATPQFQYEDLGLNFKATPYLQGNDEVRLQLELQIKNLGGQTQNGNPIITDREYTGTITVKDGETSVVAGSVTKQHIHSESGWPGVEGLPLLSTVLGSNNTEDSKSEILIVVTPHVVRKTFRKYETSFWPLD